MANAIDQTIEYLDTFINEAEKQLDEAIKTRDYLLRLTGSIARLAPTPEPAPEPVFDTFVAHYFVETRTDGPGHHIRLTGKRGQQPTAECSCKAAENGRVCWAVKGLLDLAFYSDFNLKGENSGYVYDRENLKSYLWVREGK